MPLLRNIQNTIRSCSTGLRIAFSPHYHALIEYRLFHYPLPCIGSLCTCVTEQILKQLTPAHIYYILHCWSSSEDLPVRLRSSWPCCLLAWERETRYIAAMFRALLNTCEQMLSQHKASISSSYYLYQCKDLVLRGRWRVRNAYYWSSSNVRPVYD